MKRAGMSCWVSAKSAPAGGSVNEDLFVGLLSKGPELGQLVNRDRVRITRGIWRSCKPLVSILLKRLTDPLSLFGFPDSRYPISYPDRNGMKYPFSCGQKYPDRERCHSIDAVASFSRFFCAFSFSFVSSFLSSITFWALMVAAILTLFLYFSPHRRRALMGANTPIFTGNSV